MPISQPPFIEVPFAESGLKNAIPANADNVTGNAGFDLGFPPINMTAVAAGGIPPFGQDMNGILYDITKNIQFQQTGTPTVYDSGFAAAISGYPEGAKLLKADGSGWWINTLAGNTSDPDSGGSNWLSVPFSLLGNLLVVASTAEAQALTDNTKAISPLRLSEAFKGTNQSLLTNGYQKLPGGLIIQWGSSSGSSTSFPISFPTNSFAVFLSDVSGGGTVEGLGLNTKTLSGFTTQSTAGAVGLFAWFAIGN